MPDEPHFPAPGEKLPREPYREPDKAAPASTKARVVVSRAEPPPSSKPAKAALTRDEVRALVAVTGAQRTPWRRSLWRSPALIATSVASHLLHLALGAYAYPVDVALFVAALAWIARPLFRKDGFS